MRLAAISIDLDEVDHYRAIFGLPARPSEARPAYDLAVGRALSFADRLGVPLTFFAVSDDLARPRSAAVLAEALRRGHAVESHSASHPYDLVRLDRDRIRAEVSGSFDAIERILGQRPEGFRAPGYTTSDALLDAVEEAGARFDASLLPSPPYWAAKVAALGSMHSAGKRSSAIIGPARATLGPTEPYRPGRPPFARGERSLVEIPMRVTRGPRLPVIGTSLGALGPRAARALVRSCMPCNTFSLELHAMDFLDASDPGLEGLPGHAVELSRGRAARQSSLEAAVGEVLDRGFSWVLLREIARATSPCI